ncbi:hypothetical protein WDU94_001256 [Cyamophila willieti]
MFSSRPVSIASFCLVLAVSSLHIPLVQGGRGDNRLMHCHECKGYNCIPTEDNDAVTWCARPSEACYTMVQGILGEKVIVTRGCAHVRFCQFVRQVKLYALVYCNMCGEEFCNDEVDFDNASGVADLRMTLSTFLILLMGLILLILPLLDELVRI